MLYFLGLLGRQRRRTSKNQIEEVKVEAEEEVVVMEEGKEVALIKMRKTMKNANCKTSQQLYVITVKEKGIMLTYVDIPRKKDQRKIKPIKLM